jgi:hypothetical protein
MGGLQQSELVVEPQLPCRDLRDLGEFTDPEHRTIFRLKPMTAPCALTPRQSQAVFSRGFRACLSPSREV